MNDKKSFDKAKLTPLESVYIGSATGFAAVTAYLPSWTIKMRIQCSLPFTLDPRILYRGYTAGLAVMVPVTVVQIFNTSRVESLLPGDTITFNGRAISSFLGGTLSSIFTNPLNLINTQQHKHDYQSPLIAAKAIVQKSGVKNLCIGLPTIAMADGLYTCAYYGLFSPLKIHFCDRTHNKTASALSAAILTGVSTAVITQPLDSIRTMQHQYADEKNKHGFVKCVKELYQKGGGLGFFKGIAPRAIGTTLTVLAAGTAADITESHYRNLNNR